MSEAGQPTPSDVIEHLKMIQNVIDRMGRNSFWLRGWNATLAVGWLAFVARVGVEKTPDGLWPIVPLLMLFLLDGYYLSQERRFRKLYNAVRCGKVTKQFSMNTECWEQGPFDICGIIKACLWAPFTTIIFHAPIVVLICLVENANA